MYMHACVYMSRIYEEQIINETTNERIRTFHLHDDLEWFVASCCGRSLVRLCVGSGLCEFQRQDYEQIQGLAKGSPTWSSPCPALREDPRGRPMPKHREEQGSTATLSRGHTRVFRRQVGINVQLSHLPQLLSWRNPLLATLVAVASSSVGRRESATGACASLKQWLKNLWRRVSRVPRGTSVIFQ